jgi:hypothetical protein
MKKNADKYPSEGGTRPTANADQPEGTAFATAPYERCRLGARREGILNA